MYSNIYRQDASRFQSIPHSVIDPVEYLRINNWEPPTIDRDPVTDEEYEDVFISLSEIERGEYVDIPPDATMDDIRLF